MRGKRRARGSTVWEDAVDLGYVTRRSVGARGTIVVVTAAGRALLDAQPSQPRSSRGQTQPNRKREPAA